MKATAEWSKTTSNIGRFSLFISRYTEQLTW